MPTSNQFISNPGALVLSTVLWSWTREGSVWFCIKSCRAGLLSTTPAHRMVTKWLRVGLVKIASASSSSLNGAADCVTYHCAVTWNWLFLLCYGMEMGMFMIWFMLPYSNRFRIAISHSRLLVRYIYITPERSECHYASHISCYKIHSNQQPRVAYCLNRSY